MNNELYEIDKLVDKKDINGVPHYLVKWKGFKDSDNTWESIDNLSSAKEAIVKFENKDKDKGKGKAKSNPPTILKPLESKIMTRSLVLLEDDEPEIKEIETNKKMNKSTKVSLLNESISLLNKKRDKKPVEEVKEKEKSNPKNNGNTELISVLPGKEKNLSNLRIDIDLNTSLLYQNSPRKILYAKGTVDDIIYVVEWKEQSNGIKPAPTEINSKDLAEKHPKLIVKYLEPKIKFIN